MRKIRLTRLSACCAFACAALCAAAGPQVTEVTASDTSEDVVTVTYRLSGEPAVVTFSVETNAGGNAWVKVPDSAVCRAWGDVFRMVEPDAESVKTIRWRPDACWQGIEIDDSTVRVGVTAWPTNNPPDYMVCDLGITNCTRYFVSAEGVPGGVTNDLYKTDRLLMRRIHATGVEWRMGRGWYEHFYFEKRNADGEPLYVYDSGINALTPPCRVVLSKDYYIGVYEITQRQYYLALGKNPSSFSSSAGYADAAMRPVENIAVDNCAIVMAGYIPALNAMTGAKFTLPSEAQWEFACRAGTTSALYNGNDAPATAGDIAWHKDNSAVDGVRQTHVVGTREPNAWGLYDMVGNVWEVCRDWWKNQPFTNDLHIDPEVTEQQEGAAYHVRKGGSWFATTTQWCNSSGRTYCTTPSTWWGGANCVGFRVICDAVAVK